MSGTDENAGVTRRQFLELSATAAMAVGTGGFAWAAEVRGGIPYRGLGRTGEKVQHRAPETREELSAQDEQIARFAREGLSNREIAGTLYLSSRTIEWHLRKVFAKLGISSRGELRTALDDQVVSQSRG